MDFDEFDWKTLNNKEICEYDNAIYGWIYKIKCPMKFVYFS